MAHRQKQVEKHNQDQKELQMFVSDAINAGRTSLDSAQVKARLGNKDRYFATILAYQDADNLPHLSHTFAVFTRVKGRRTIDSVSDSEVIENHTISWLPADLNIKLLRIQPEPGKNLGLAETLALAAAEGLSVTVRGPFAIKKTLYNLALARIELLNSGKVKFIVLDWFLRGNGAINCIHAVSDLDVTQPPLRTGTARGDAASAAVAQHLRHWFLPADDEDTSWLRKSLNLQNLSLEK